MASDVDLAPLSRTALATAPGPEPGECVDGCEHIECGYIVRLERWQAARARSMAGAVPALIEEVERLRAEVDRYRLRDEDLGTYEEVLGMAADYCAETDAVHRALDAAGMLDGDWLRSETRTLATEVARLAAERDAARSDLTATRADLAAAQETIGDLNGTVNRLALVVEAAVRERAAEEALARYQRETPRSRHDQETIDDMTVALRTCLANRRRAVDAYCAAEDAR